MKKRLTQPKNNKYYIRQVTGGLNGAVAGSPTIAGANVLCNCVGYANGRFNEAINDPNLMGTVSKFQYQLVCNAENFIESAKRQGLKISSSPVTGGIMVWQKGATLGGGDGAGHVAFVEAIYDDGTILTSESGWASWAFKTVRRNNSNGRWGQASAYKFRGCIINPAVKSTVEKAPKLAVDGVGGACTVRAMQRFFSTIQDGVISGQSKAQNKYYPALKSVEYGKGGSPCIKNLQKWVGTAQDGVLGEQTVKAWQKKLGVSADGIFGANSVRAWQEYLNTHDKAVYPTPRKSYKVIDVSDWQSQIDWAKVKADGVVGAIIRFADGSTLDKRFAENMRNAKANGVHIGAYIFSRAKTKAEAEAEATRLFNACKPYAPDMPLYIDLEAKGLEENANTVAQAFLIKIKALGGRGGVYANLNWWNNYLKDTAKNYSSNAFWIAQYNSTMDYSPASIMGMWQYSSSGSVKGISGKVDMDKCYNPYWETAPTEPPKKSINEIAHEVLAGQWGSGDERKKRLTEAGYDYDAVQKRVNEICVYLDKIMSACKAQAECMRNSKYAWESNPTIEKSKKKGTCVTYVACVLQRLGILQSGQFIWQNGKGYGTGKVTHANDKMNVKYMDNKTLTSLKSQLQKGDIILLDDNKSGEEGNGGHILILAGKWTADGKPYVWDNHSAQQNWGAYAYNGNRKVLARVRLKEVM